MRLLRQDDGSAGLPTGPLRRHALETLAAIGVLVAIVVLAPGLGEVRGLLGEADPRWLALAAVLEASSFASYLLMFAPIFCAGLSWRRSWQIGGAELATVSLAPTSGASGLAVGGWILHRGGMDADRVARRSVAFFVIKSGVNFIAVAVLGTAMTFGLGPELSLWLTALPAGLAVLAIASVAVIACIGPGPAVAPEGSSIHRAASAVRRALTRGSREAWELVRSRDPRVLCGAVGYWAFDNAVLWATFHSLGVSLPLPVILMGYLVGQLGALLPLPGGIGGIDLGLIGGLILYGSPPAATAAAVLSYHLILFWLPLIIGGFAFASLRRDMPSGAEFAAATR